MYIATKKKVKNRGIPGAQFLDALVAWGKTAAEDIFAPNTAQDVYSGVVGTLGPWTGPAHRRAAMPADAIIIHGVLDAAGKRLAD